MAGQVYLAMSHSNGWFQLIMNVFSTHAACVKLAKLRLGDLAVVRLR